MGGTNTVHQVQRQSPRLPGVNALVPTLLLSVADGLLLRYSTVTSTTTSQRGGDPFVHVASHTITLDQSLTPYRQIAVERDRTGNV